MNNDQRPDYQADNAAQAQPNSQDPAVSNNAPNYGSFGTAEGAAQAAAVRSANPNTNSQNDGSNDNPDEFSEFRKSSQPATEDYSAQSQQAADAGAASYNGGRATSNARPEGFEKSEDVARAAFAEDDPRYGSGTQTSWPSNEPAQENTDMKGGYDPTPNV